MPNPVPNIGATKNPDVSANFDELLRVLEVQYANIPQKKLERFQFTWDGLEFDIRRVAEPDRYRFLITAMIGYMPFSIESEERREAIRTIIFGSRSLPVVRFGVNLASRISAGAFFDVKRMVAPDFLFYPLVLFLQEARPFINLIGKYLSEPPHMPAQASKTPVKTN